MVMVFHQNRVARIFIKKSAPRPRILGFAPVCITWGDKAWGDGKALLRRTERIVWSNPEDGNEKLDKMDATEQTAVPQVASKCSCKKEGGIRGTSIQPVWQRGPDTMTGL